MGFICAVKWRNDFRILLDCRAAYTDCVCVCEHTYLEIPLSYAPYFLVHTFLAWETKEKCSNLWLYSNPPEGIKHKGCVENKIDVVRKHLTCSICLLLSTYFRLYVCRRLLEPCWKLGKEIRTLCQRTETLEDTLTLPRKRASRTPASFPAPSSPNRALSMPFFFVRARTSATKTHRGAREGGGELTCGEKR